MPKCEICGKDLANPKSAGHISSKYHQDALKKSEGTKPAPKPKAAAKPAPKAAAKPAPKAAAKPAPKAAAKPAPKAAAKPAPKAAAKPAPKAAAKPAPKAAPKTKVKTKKLGSRLERWSQKLRSK